MSKTVNLKKNNRVDPNNYVFLIGLIVLAIIFLVTISIIIIRPNDVKSINAIKEVTLSEYDAMGTEEKKDYLVFVYASEQNDYYDFPIHNLDLVKREVLKYATYAKNHKDAMPIYRLDISKSENANAITRLNLTDETYIPAVLKLKLNSSKASVVQTKNTVEDVCEYLRSLCVTK